MSISVLLRATRNVIRSEINLENEMCRIMPGARPPPSCGQKFFAVFASDWVSGGSDLNLGIDESYSISVAITFRAGFAPFDDQGEELYIKSLESMEAHLRHLLVLIDKSYEILGAANNLIDSSTVYKLYEPLRFQNADPAPRYVDASWFDAKTDNPDPYAGLVQQINFSGARRSQPVSTSSQLAE